MTHNPEVAGSNPAPAYCESPAQAGLFRWLSSRRDFCVAEQVAAGRDDAVALQSGGAEGESPLRRGATVIEISSGRLISIVPLATAGLAGTGACPSLTVGRVLAAGGGSSTGAIARSIRSGEKSWSTSARWLSGRCCSLTNWRMRL